MDEQIVYDFMSKMYLEFTEFRKDITAKVDQNTVEIKNLNSQVMGLDNKVTDLSNKFEVLDNKVTDLSNKFEVLDNKVTDLSNKFEVLDNKVTDLGNQFTKLSNHVISMENEFSIKTSALFDGYKQLDSKLDRVEAKLDCVCRTVERQAVEIRVIQGNKKIAKLK